jgi:hypothetical protein
VISSIIIREGNMLARRTTTALLAVLALTHATQLVASECIRLRLRDVRRQVDLMFSGTVTNVQPLTVGRLIVDIEVDQVWKGWLPRKTTIYTYAEPHAAPFIKGGRYLITAPRYLLLEFLDKKREKLELPADSTSCGWGVPYDSVEQELAALERPRTPH